MLCCTNISVAFWLCIAIESKYQNLYFILQASVFDCISEREVGVGTLISRVYNKSIKT